MTRETTRRLDFPRDDGSWCTIENYFKELYSQSSSIALPLLPCLHVGPKEENIYIPIDACKVINQKCMKKLTDAQTSSMICHTAKGADKQRAEIMQVVKLANFHRDHVLKEFNMDVSTSM